jgi:hypothetical protein
MSFKPTRNSNTGNFVEVIDTYDKLIEHWDFLLEGLEKVRAGCIDNIPDVSNEEFFKTVLKISCEPHLGLVIILKSKNGKPLGYLVLIDTTAMFRPKTLTVYMIYSSGLCPSAFAELRFEGDCWARKNGFVKLQALSYRLKPLPRRTGAVQRFFNKTLGLRLRCVVFEAEF